MLQCIKASRIKATLIRMTSKVCASLMARHGAAGFHAFAHRGSLCSRSLGCARQACCGVQVQVHFAAVWRCHLLPPILRPTPRSLMPQLAKLQHACLSDAEETAPAQLCRWPPDKHSPAMLEVERRLAEPMPSRVVRAKFRHAWAQLISVTTLCQAQLCAHYWRSKDAQQHKV